ncbi:MAG: copper uptake system-associated protein [Betaproteobacteria bacterium]
MHTFARLAQRIAFLVLCHVCFTITAHAHSFGIGQLKIEHPYAPPSRHPTVAGVFFKGIVNQGKEADELIAASSPAAQTVELHQMLMQGDVMKMRAVSTIALPANSSVSFKHGQPDTFHLMLIGLKQPLKDGDRFPVTLKFKRAGEVEVMVWVQSLKADTGSHAHDSHSAHQPGGMQSDEAAITHVMKSQFDRPEAPLTVMPVSTDGNFAVAGWIQGSTGGRALLKKDGGKWLIHLCAGDALKQVSTLEMAGIDAATAKRLAQKVAAAERRLSAEHVRKLSLFEGILRVDGGAHHGHGHAHGPAHGHASPARSQH